MSANIIIIRLQTNLGVKKFKEISTSSPLSLFKDAIVNEYKIKNPQDLHLACKDCVASPLDAATLDATRSPSSYGLENGSILYILGRLVEEKVMSSSVTSDGIFVGAGIYHRIENVDKVLATAAGAAAGLVGANPNPNPNPTTSSNSSFSKPVTATATTGTVTSGVSGGGGGSAAVKIIANATSTVSQPAAAASSNPNPNPNPSSSSSSAAVGKPPATPSITIPAVASTNITIPSVASTNAGKINGGVRGIAAYTTTTNNNNTSSATTPVVRPSLTKPDLIGKKTEQEQQQQQIGTGTGSGSPRSSSLVPTRQQLTDMGFTDKEIDEQVRKFILIYICKQQQQQQHDYFAIYMDKLPNPYPKNN